MKIRTRILIYMFALTTLSGFAVLVSSIVLYKNQQNLVMNAKNNISQMVVEQEINHLKENARIAASRVAINHALIGAVISKDRDSIREVVKNLQFMNRVDFCTILDNQGKVIARTHDSLYGDDLTHYFHIKSAMDGNIESDVAAGMTMRFCTFAGAPVYDEKMNIVGVVSLGFKLNNQDFVHRLKTITNGDVSIFLGNERVASTILTDDGEYALGTKADENISKKVLAGEHYSGHIPLFGKDLFVKYSPLCNTNNEIVGMQCVGFYTAVYKKSTMIFIFVGLAITLAVLAACVIIARFVSASIERRMEGMMNEIRKADEYTNLLFNSTPMSCVLWERTLKIVNCNQDALDLFKAKSKEELSERFAELSNEFQPDGRESRKFSIINTEKAFVDGYHRFEWMHKNLEGEPLPCEVTLMRVKYKDNHLVAAYTRDLREHKAHLAEINKLHNIMEKLLKSMDTMIMVTDVESDKIIYLNEKFRNEFSFSDDAIGKECWKQLVENASERCGFCPKNDLDVNSKKVISWEFYNPITKGDYKITSRFIDWPDGSKVFMEQCTDISEVKKLIADITKAREAAEAANKTKSTFLANMSHEIRTPMNSIIGFSELARDGDLPAKTREYLRNIHDSAEWLLKIINDILDISKIESGKIELEYIPFDLPDIFAHCQSVIMPKAKEKGITLYCYAEPSVGKKLLGDPVRLSQVFINLLSNAIKFTNVGTVKLLAAVKKVDDNSITMHFEIKDSGIGMSQEQIEKIFEPFTQADGSITRRFGGTGLGLTISKSIIESMGGTLNVESMVGVGSKFCFELTFELIDDASDVSSEKLIINDFEKPHFKGRVLVCEDNSLNQQVICDHLARVGLKTTVAYNGKEGVDIITERIKNNEKPFDLIFMDIHMPVMDGLDAAAKITGLGVRAPIIALTANIMSNDLEHYKINGMSDFLGKPFTSRELWKCLMKYLPVESLNPVDSAVQLQADEKLQKQLELNFVKSNQNLLADIKRNTEEGDIKEAHRLAHSLKSNAGQIGRKHLQEAAATVEEMLSHGKNLLSGAMLNNLEAEMKLALEELKPLLEAENVSVPVETLSREKANEVIERLEPMLINRNPAVINLLSEIRAMPEAQELASHIEDFEFKRALDTLSQLKERWKKQ